MMRVFIFTNDLVYRLAGESLTSSVQWITRVYFIMTFSKFNKAQIHEKYTCMDLR
jgi:hypothetical protein